MFAVRAHNPLEDELTRLAEALQGLDMRAADLLAPELVEERDRILRTVRGYLMPRLTDPGRPMTVVVAGPTGSGKSTIVNSLVGLDLAETGALRPTTRTPLVVTTAEHEDRFADLGGVRCHVAAARAPILTRMALVDTPDIDSTLVEHRKMAERLIDTADVVVFVTSALRYADRVPWEVLRRAVDRGAPLITILNRLTSPASAAVADYRARLARAGIEAQMIRVPEQRGGPGLGRVPSLAIKELAVRLQALAEGLDGGRLAGMTVAEKVLTDADRLEGSLQGLTRLLERKREEIEDLVERGRSRLDLDAVLKGVSLPVAKDSRLRRLLRLPALRISHDDLLRWLEMVSARLSSVVETELRATAMELERALPRMPAPVMIEPALVTTATAIHGWLAFLRRATEGMGRRKRDLAMASVIIRTLGKGDEETVVQILGPSGEALAAEARAHLEDRLTVAFSQLGMVGSARVEALVQAGPRGGIAELVTRVRARLTFADA